MAQAAEFRFNPQVNWAGAGQQQARMGQGMDAFGQGITRLIQRKRQKKMEAEAKKQEIAGATNYINQFHPEIANKVSPDEMKQMIGTMGLEEFMDRVKQDQEMRQSSQMHQATMGKMETEAAENKATTAKLQMELDTLKRTQPDRVQLVALQRQNEEQGLKIKNITTENLAFQRRNLDQEYEANIAEARQKLQAASNDQERHESQMRITALQEGRDKELHNLEVATTRNELLDKDSELGAYAGDHLGNDKILRPKKGMAWGIFPDKQPDLGKALTLQRAGVADGIAMSREEAANVRVKGLNIIFPNGETMISGNNAPADVVEVSGDDDPRLDTLPIGTKIRTPDGKTGVWTGR